MTELIQTAPYENIWSYAGSHLLSLVTERGLVWSTAKHRTTERPASDIKKLIDATWSWIEYSPDYPSTMQACGVIGQMVIHLACHPAQGFTTVGVTVWSNDFDKAREIIEGIFEQIPEVQVSEDHYLLKAWNHHPEHGAICRSRRILVPNWDDIIENYPESTRSQVEGLGTLQPPFEFGKLVLFHGLPGTGKTSLIRALANRWKTWSRFHYVLDPEEFFSNPNYLLSVMFDDTYEGDPGPDGTPPWKVIIIEDCDEIIAADAKARTGQSLSRLLALGDGLLGQGLAQLVLITTNEPLEKLHPAVVRQGRCLAEVYFNAFEPHEARNWARNRDFELTPSSEETYLADLFAAYHQHAKIYSTRKMAKTGTYL